MTQLKERREKKLGLGCTLSLILAFPAIGLVVVVVEVVEHHERMARDSVQVPRQIGNLKDTDTGVRYHAAEALGDLGFSEAVEPLIAALNDSDAGLRSRAAVALGKFNVGAIRRAVEPLIVALKDSDSNVRKNAAEALGKITDPRAVEPLINALKDTDSNVRTSAAEALGRIKDPRAVEPLIA